MTVLSTASKREILNLYKRGSDAAYNGFSMSNLCRLGYARANGWVGSWQTFELTLKGKNKASQIISEG